MTYPLNMVYIDVNTDNLDKSFFQRSNKLHKPAP